MGTAVAILVLILVVAALAYPFWRPPLIPLGQALGPASQMAALQERKQGIYGAIRDVGFDLRTDKVTEEDYEIEAEKLKSEAVEVIAAIEALRSAPPRGSDHVEALIAATRGSEPWQATARSQEQGAFCTHCGRRAGATDRFCAGCGHALEGAS